MSPRQTPRSEDITSEDFVPDEPAGGLGMLYGRRHGHKLRAHQAALFETLLPKINVELAPEGKTFQLTDCFDEPFRETWLEIGYGGGEHLAGQAEAHPDVGFIGCEFFLNGVAKMLAQIEAGDLKNIRLFRQDAKELLTQLPKASISRAFILFPDPWPKARHAKRRMISPYTLHHLAHVMKPGAELRVATDIPNYCRWTLKHIRQSPAFDWQAEGPEDWRVRPDDWPGTRYEAKALHEGRTPVYLRFRRTGHGAHESA